MAVYSSDAYVLPKPVHYLLRQLTGESRPDVALSLALRDLVRLRLEAAHQAIAGFEAKYKLSFEQFEAQWKAGQIQAAYSYAVEQDYWAWEAAEAEVEVLDKLAENLV
jgi:hypothetical protein